MEGSASDPTVGIVHTTNNIIDEGKETATKNRKKMVHHLALSSASDFGSSAESDHNNDMHNHDEHLHHDNDDEHQYHGAAAGGGMPHDVNEFCTETNIAAATTSTDACTSWTFLLFSLLMCGLS